MVVAAAVDHKQLHTAFTPFPVHHVAELARELVNFTTLQHLKRVSGGATGFIVKYDARFLQLAVPYRRHQQDEKHNTKPRKRFFELFARDACVDTVEEEALLKVSLQTLFASLHSPFIEDRSAKVAVCLRTILTECRGLFPVNRDTFLIRQCPRQCPLTPCHRHRRTAFVLLTRLRSATWRRR